MAFTVEDGTGVSGANSMTTVAFADAYFVDRGNAVWAAASSGNKQTALIKGTDYIETRWADLFKGRIEFETQELSFPRLNLFDRSNRQVLGMPDKLQKAASEYALRALSDSLYLEPTVEETGQAVKSKRERVAPIEEEIVYVDGGATSTLKDFPEADNLLAEYISNFSGGSVIRN